MDHAVKPVNPRAPLVMDPEDFKALRARILANPTKQLGYGLEPLRVPKARTLVKKPLPVRNMELLRLRPRPAPSDPWSYGPCVFPGQLCSKSNSRRLVMRGKTPAIIKSAESLAFVEDFVKCFRTASSYEGDVSLTVMAYYQDRRRDLDIALLQDALQAAGVIKNDRQVVEIHATRHLDKENPRTWFLLTAMGEA